MDYISNHVTYDQIRNAVGVSEAELSDGEIDSSGLEYELQLETDLWLPEAADTDAIYTDGTNPSATRTERIRYYAFSTYLKNYAGYLLFNSGKLKFAKKISDSDNSIERFDWVESEIIQRLLSQANKAQNQVLDSYGVETEPYLTGVYAGKSSPDFDPVTG